VKACRSSAERVLNRSRVSIPRCCIHDSNEVVVRPPYFNMVSELAQLFIAWDGGEAPEGKAQPQL
jgi:hypothetical protein